MAQEMITFSQAAKIYRCITGKSISAGRIKKAASNFPQLAITVTSPTGSRQRIVGIDRDRWAAFVGSRNSDYTKKRKGDMFHPQNHYVFSGL